MEKSKAIAIFWSLIWTITVAFGSAQAFAAQTCTATANTSGNQTVPEASIVNGVRTPSTIMLNGTPSKPNQDITFLWTQSPADQYQVTLSDPSISKPTFTAPNVGPNGATLHFLLTVKACDPVQTSSASVIVNVTNVNSPPVASAIVSPAGTVNEGTLVTLDGSSSVDPDGDALTYAWTQTGAGTAVPLVASGPTATFIAPNDAYPDGETLTFRLTVSDGWLSASTDKTVNIVWVNDPPVAAVSCTSQANEGAPVVLDGSASHDPDNGIGAYSWSQISGGPDAGLSGDVLSQPTLSFLAPALTSPYTTMNFKLTVTDNGNLSTSSECAVVVNDVTPPVITAPTDITAEATSGAGAVVSFNASAHDAVDGDLAVTCTPASDGVFSMGVTSVSCSATDTAGNTGSAGFKVTVQDTTPPALSLPSPITKEATGPSGADVKFSASALDLVDGAVPASCIPLSGSTFPLGTTIVICSASDSRGNKATGSFTVTVQDTTPPALSLPSDISATATANSSAIVNYSATANDLVDSSVPVSCTPASGSLFTAGATTVSCSASDSRGNKAIGNFTVAVVFNWTGFFQPIGNMPVINGVKAGSAAPVKFSLSGNQGLSIMPAGSPGSAAIACDSTALVDDVTDALTAGSSSLTYDPGADQYIYVWKTDKAWAGTCRQFQVRLADGSVHSANFKFAK